MKKIEIFCQDCDATFEIIHDLNNPYIITYCPFCGTELQEDDDIIEDEDILFYDEEYDLL